MPELLHPDVVVVEKKPVPKIQGANTTTPGFLVYTKKGSTKKAGLVTGFSDFVRQYGSFYRGSLGPHAIKNFFDTAASGGAGANRCFVGRVVGAGAAVAEKDFVNMSEVGTAAVISGTEEITTLDLTNKRYLNIEVDNGGVVKVDLGSSGVSPITARTIADIIASINAAIPTIAQQEDGFVILTSPTLGVGSEVEITPVTDEDFSAVYTPSQPADVASLNPGNFNIILNIDSLGAITIDVTADGGNGGGYDADLLVININAALDSAHGAVYNSVASNVGGAIVLTSPTQGDSSSIVIGDGPSGKAGRLEVFGIPEGTGAISAFGGAGDAITAVLGFVEGSTVTANGTANVPSIFTVKTQNEGDWGNVVSVSTLRWKADLVEPVLTGQEEAQIGNFNGVEIGNIVEISDGTTTIVVVVNDIDLDNSKIIFTGQGTAHLTIAAGTDRVKCSTSHRRVTRLVGALTTGATIATLENTIGINVGTRVLFDSFGVNPIRTVIVTGISGNQITFDAIAGAVSDNAVASTMHFDILVKDAGEVIKRHQFLSTESTDLSDYFGVRLFGDSNESEYIELEELAFTLIDPVKSPPKPVEDVVLEGGLDGALPSDLDWVGREVEPKTGVFLFDSVDDISIIAAPGVTFTTTMRRLISYCENTRGDILYVGDVPLVDDQPLEARNFLISELQARSSFLALYYPWGKIRNPESNQPDSFIDVPLSSFAVGAMINKSVTENVSVAPANYPLLTLDGLTHQTSDGEQDVLNPIGINVIRAFPNEGITIWGARTTHGQDDAFKYIGTRRLTNFIKRSVKVGNRFAIFRHNDSVLWDQLRRINKAFLLDLWRQRMLYPPDNPDKALFVKVDEENNPRSSRLSGIVNIEIGFGPQVPAEFIVIQVGLLDGEETSEETLRKLA